MAFGGCKKFKKRHVGNVGNRHRGEWEYEPAARVAMPLRLLATKCKGPVRPRASPCRSLLSPTHREASQVAERRAHTSPGTCGFVVPTPV